MEGKLTIDQIEAIIENVLNAEPEANDGSMTEDEYQAYLDHFQASQFEAVEVYGNMEAEKIDGIAAYFRKEEAMQELWSKEAKRLIDKKKASENRVKAFKQYLLSVFEKDGLIVGGKLAISGNFSKFSMRTNKNTVDILSEDMIPEDMYSERIVREISKTAIKNAILAGEEVPGARLKDTYSLIVK